ncbi:hypothetical protein ACTXT7_001605 [Hymenolepis weldensis]
MSDSPEIEKTKRTWDGWLVVTTQLILTLAISTVQVSTLVKIINLKPVEGKYFPSHIMGILEPLHEKRVFHQICTDEDRILDL